MPLRGAFDVNEHMQQIDFHFNVTNRALYACRLIQKVMGLGKTVAVWGTDATFMNRVYADLWRFEDMTVIPHAWAKSEFEADAPVVFAMNIADLQKADVLVLLDENVPENWQQAFASFERIVDIVSTQPEDLQHSRNRYRLYRSAGVELKAYDRSQS